MDLPPLSAATITSLQGSAAGDGRDVPVATLRRALEIQQQSALQLLESIPSPPDPATGVGRYVDVRV